MDGSRIKGLAQKAREKETWRERAGEGIKGPASKKDHNSY